MHIHNPLRIHSSVHIPQADTRTQVDKKARGYNNPDHIPVNPALTRARARSNRLYGDDGGRDYGDGDRGDDGRDRDHAHVLCRPKQNLWEPTPEA